MGEAIYLYDEIRNLGLCAIDLISGKKKRVCGRTGECEEGRGGKVSSDPASRESDLPGMAGMGSNPE